MSSGGPQDRGSDNEREMAPEETASQPQSVRRRPGPLLVGLACLSLGLVIGWTASVVFPKGYRVPSAQDLEKLCATAPDVEFRKWEYIVLHHSAFDIGDAAAIDNYHRRGQGWKNGLGYDFVIGNGSLSGNGEIGAGDRWARQLDGAHCRADNMNQKAIGICFIGNFDDRHGPSEQQIHSGLALVRWLVTRFAIPPERILGHGQVDGAGTKCPGRLFPMSLFRAAAQEP